MKRVILILTLALVLLAACFPAKKTLNENILGTWQNNDGYTIEFKDGGAGFIPGVPGKIPDSSFTYLVTDDSHIQIVFQGQKQDIGILIAGDQMTWTDDLGEVAYTRVKPTAK